MLEIPVDRRPADIASDDPLTAPAPSGPSPAVSGPSNTYDASKDDMAAMEDDHWPLKNEDAVDPQDPDVAEKYGINLSYVVPDNPFRRPADDFVPSEYEDGNNDLQQHNSAPEVAMLPKNGKISIYFIQSLTILKVNGLGALVKPPATSNGGGFLGSIASNLKIFF